MMLPLGCRLPDGLVDMEEYVKTNGTFYDIPVEVIDRMNCDYEAKMREFNAEDNESRVESANMIADI